MLTICSLTVLPSISIVLILKSTPIVEMYEDVYAKRIRESYLAD